MATLTFDKELGGAEDLLLDATAPATVNQTRASGIVAISKINADTIPYTGTFGGTMTSIKDELDSKIGAADAIISTNANGGIGVQAGPGSYTWTDGTPLTTEASLYQLLGSGNASWLMKLTLGSNNVLFQGTVGGEDAIVSTDYVTLSQSVAAYIAITNALTTPSPTNKVVTEAECLSTLTESNQLIAEDDLLAEMNTYATTPIALGNKIITAADGVGDALALIINDTKTSGTNGGTSTAGSWQTRDLNTIDYNTISGASLTTNQITLPAGTYEVNANVPAHNTSLNQARLYDTTNTVELVLGDALTTTSGFGNSGTLHVIGTFVLAVTAVIELQHRCSVTVATVGFGTAISWGENTYSTINIRKLA